MSRQLLMSPSGAPCNPPPWVRWSRSIWRGGLSLEYPVGDDCRYSPEFAAQHGGTPNLGGPIITAGGLVFIAAAMDNYLRAFDIDTGAELWKGRLPAGGQATPMTYRLRPDGKQFVVIAAGGTAIGTKLGDPLVAFALP